jgi:hypothetical protein
VISRSRHARAAFDPVPATVVVRIQRDLVLAIDGPRVVATSTRLPGHEKILDVADVAVERVNAVPHDLVRVVQVGVLGVLRLL